jgi:hypothetical protein
MTSFFVRDPFYDKISYFTKNSHGGILPEQTLFDDDDAHEQNGGFQYSEKETKTNTNTNTNTNIPEKKYHVGGYSLNHFDSAAFSSSFQMGGKNPDNNSENTEKELVIPLGLIYLPESNHYAPTQDHDRNRASIVLEDMIIPSINTISNDKFSKLLDLVSFQTPQRKSYTRKVYSSSSKKENKPERKTKSNKVTRNLSSSTTKI